MSDAFCAALLLLIPLWRRPIRRVMLFALVAAGTSWILMALSEGGGSAHHAILLWPLPHLVVAVAFAEAFTRFHWAKWTLAAALPFLVTTNLLVTNQYLYQFIKNGPADYWTDAIGNLAQDLRHSDASVVLLPDWGLTDSLTTLNEEHPPDRIVGRAFLAKGESPAQKQEDLETLRDARAIWVEHTPDHEVFEGVNDTILNAAKESGFDIVHLQTFQDSFGRPMFQTLRFIPKQPQQKDGTYHTLQSH